jgi:hypothetical protein
LNVDVRQLQAGPLRITHGFIDNASLSGQRHFRPALSQPAPARLEQQHVLGENPAGPWQRAVLRRLPR